MGSLVGVFRDPDGQAQPHSRLLSEGDWRLADKRARLLAPLTAFPMALLNSSSARRENPKHLGRT